MALPNSIPAHARHHGISDLDPRGPSSAQEAGRILAAEGGQRRTQMRLAQPVGARTEKDPDWSEWLPIATLGA